jgi:hypothetical protein
VEDDGSPQRIKRLPLRSPAYYAVAGTFTMVLLALFAGCVGAIIGSLFGPITTGVLAVLACVGSGVAWSAWMWPQQLAMGADGLLVSSWRGSSMVPFESIARASFENASWCFVLHDETKLRFPTDWTKEEQETASELLEKAIAAHPPPDREPADLDAWLGRGEQSTDVWVSRLRRLLSQATQGYRSAAPDRDTLREVLLRGTAPPQQRVAAAIALCAEGHGEEREHVRVASEVTVQPELQEAFRIIAVEDDDLAAGQALEGLEKMKVDPTR